MKMSCMPVSLPACASFSSMMTFPATFTNVGEMPTEVLRTSSPSGVISEASTMATSISPRNP